MGQHVPDARAPWSETVYKGTRVWVIGVSLLVPYLIVLLSFRPTRSSLLLRGAMVPLALWAMWEVIVTYNMDKRESSRQTRAELTEDRSGRRAAFRTCSELTSVYRSESS